MWLATYPCFMIALWALGRHNRAGEPAGRLLDTVILVVGGDTVMWVFLVSNAIHAAGLRPFAHLVSVLFPIMDVIVFSMLVRLVVATRRTPATRLLVASFVSLLAADSWYALELARGTYHVGGPTDALWMLSYLLIAVAALHPSRAAFPPSRSVSDYLLTPARLIFLGAVLLVEPVLLLIRRQTLLRSHAPQPCH
jgi:diguanylate cyclase